MTTVTPMPSLTAVYPTAHVRGRLITRLEEQTLGWATLDAATALEMGREQVGWFVGGHPGVARAAEQLGRLDSNPAGGVWIVAPHSRDLARDLFTKWPHQAYVTQRPQGASSVWCSRKVWVAIPEELDQLLPRAPQAEAGVAGVIVLDPPCIIHKSRGGTDSWGHVHRNDRPQHVVDFRASLLSDDWQPPLLLVTERPARAVETQAVARTYCLNAFRFVAGDSFACWEIPVVCE
ncbi:hypothetical protein R5W23_004166 [Gemmata sp. JC673]|uniref:Uncharacterized protein n=1 Tax=Gemmata algarum TaxID=2975278 RepID=A0ABU5F6D3_9BACT|nr:hypothetical protein [Gemmata algarum]MDY3562688.1 hypothetical protein [Gemmata algarum]